MRIFWTIVFSIFLVNCAGKNPGKYHRDSRWSKPVNKLNRTCQDYCSEVGLQCAEECVTSRGLEGWGAEAWFNTGEIESGRRGSGQATCTQVGDPKGPEPRWRCCCVGKKTIVKEKWSPCMNPTETTCSDFCDEWGRELGTPMRCDQECFRPKYGRRFSSAEFSSESSCEQEHWTTSVPKENRSCDDRFWAEGRSVKCCCTPDFK